MDKKIKKILRILEKNYPDAKTALIHKNPLELLIATILSAQCTDNRVNIVTKSLFKKYKKASDYARASLKDFEKDIYSCGFYRNKAKNIINTCAILNKKFDDKIPNDFNELLELPGVARKTANCIMGNVFHIPSGVIVDTHVLRLSQRLGLTKNTDANKVEQDLMKLIQKDQWIIFSHRIISHGRQVCDAKKPKCEICDLNKLCPSAFKIAHRK